MGLQCKLFQSLDRRETIIVFRLNGHQTKFVCEVLVLGIRKKFNMNFVKGKNSKIFKVFQSKKQSGFGIHSELFYITLKFSQNFAATCFSDKIPTEKLCTYISAIIFIFLRLIFGNFNFNYRIFCQQSGCGILQEFQLGILISKAVGFDYYLFHYQ